MKRKLLQLGALMLVSIVVAVVLNLSPAGCSERDSWSYEVGHVLADGRFQPQTSLLMLPINDSEDVAAMAADRTGQGCYIIRVIVDTRKTRPRDTVPASQIFATIRMRATNGHLLSPGVRTAFDLSASTATHAEYQSHKIILFNESDALEGELSDAVVVLTELNATVEVVKSPTNPEGTFCGFPLENQSIDGVSVSQQEATAGSAGSRSVKVQVEIPKTSETHVPLWWTLAIAASPDIENDPWVYLDHEPELSLRSITTGDQIASLTNRKHQTAGSWPISIIPLGGSGVYRKKYLLNDEFGILQPGSYELTMKISAMVPKEVTPHLQGRQGEAPVYTSPTGSLMSWVFPEQKVRFRVIDSPKERATEVFARVQCFAAQNKIRNIEVPDWLSLLLINDESAWDFLSGHLHQGSRCIGHTASLFLLNYGTAEEAVRRVAPLLLSDCGWAKQVALDVISRRGSPKDAVLLRGLLQPELNSIHRQAFTCLARMLEKPLPTGFENRAISANDVSLALEWLNALPSPSTGGASNALSMPAGPIDR